MQSETHWMVKNWRGAFAPFTGSYTRAGAIERVMELFNEKQTWKRLYRQGWRAVRVRITEV